LLLRGDARAAVATGALGSALVAVGGFGVGAVPASLADSWLHDSSGGRVASLCLCIVGVLLLLAAWWRLRGAPSRTVLLAASVWVLPLLVTPPLFSRDVYAYAGQAHLVDVGIDPYAHGPADAPGPLSAEVDDVWAHARSPYGPVFLRVASWLVPGQHVVTAVLLLRLLTVVGLVLLAWGVHRLSADSARGLWLAVANPLVLLHGVGGAHNDLLMAGLLAAGLAVATTGRPLPGDPRTVAGTFAATTDAESAAKDPWITEKRDGALAARALADGARVAGALAARALADGARVAGALVAGALAAGAALITVAALVKAPAAAALAFLPFLVPAARVRAAAIVAATAAVVAIVLTAASGLGWGWVHTLGAGNARRSLMSVSTGVGVLASNVAGAGAVDVAHTIGLLMAAAIGAALLVRANRLGALRALGLTLLAAVVLGPVVQPWYLLWALPALAATAGARLAVGVAASSAVLCLLVLPSGRHVIRPPLYGVPAVLTIALGYAAARSSHSKAEISSTT
jgi:hypothetical protein